MSELDTDYFKFIGENKWAINLDTFLVSDPGLFKNVGFRKIMDSEYFNPTTCLCCYSVKSTSSAKIVGKLFDTLMEYYEPEQKEKEELVNVDVLKKTMRSWDHIDERIQIINKKLINIYVSYPQCKFNVIWVYANHSSRKFLKDFISVK